MVGILDMPESPAELGRWLDRILMSEDLLTVIDELSVVHQATDESLSAEDARDWLGDNFSAVMQSGLSALSHARLRELLLRPSLLPAIQELAFVSGGPYWNRLVGDDKRTEPTKRNNRWLLYLTPLAVAASIAAFVAIDAGRDRERGASLPKSDLTITRGTDGGAGISTAGPDKPWGWNRTDLMDGIESPATIPARLAKSLGEWFQKVPTGNSDLELFTLRVNELWAGCEQVSVLPLDGLSTDLQQRLRSRVADFQREVETVLKDLDGPIPESEKASVLAAAKKAIDSSVREAVETLQDLK
jgi:hypothetical protein